jgi:hypothetical protein
MMSLARYYRFLLRMFALTPVLLAANTAQAGVRCYMIIFGAQTQPKIPRFTHTFCTIARVADPLPGCTDSRMEVYTISWLPRTMIIHPYRFRAEPGHNFTLEQTLRWCAQHRMDVSEWGPYAITEDYFWRVYREYARFERGQYLYRAIDGRRRGDIASDCIHAVTDIDPYDPRSSYPVLRSGDAVTYKFVSILRQRGRLMDPPEDTFWLDAALGLHCYPISHRSAP